MLPRILALALLSATTVLAQDQTDSSPHRVQFVNVSHDVQLEVLDWGGGGRPLIFLAGMGNDAHVFDKFAPKFIPKYHVFGITRRGFGASSQPAPTVENYSAERLGDDVLAVRDALQIDRPVLAGHSVAGEELSSIGSRHPEKVAGLVYFDAGYAYAYYDRVHGDLWLDLIDIRKRIDELQASKVQNRKGNWVDMLADISHVQAALQDITRQMASMSNVPSPPPVATAIQFGQEKYTELHVPILAIFALPRVFDAHTVDQINAFEAGLPSAHVVRLKNASHYVFQSNEADVLREVNAFLAGLP